MREIAIIVGGFRYNTTIQQRKAQMKTIEHSLRFITELDENDPTAQRILSLPETMQINILEGLLKALNAPALKPILDECNAGNSYATLKVVL